jgi:demethylmenaquinone methyltransferase/2-methoxy-6-polyprenyl-1,4-benzoquinol methylase
MAPDRHPLLTLGWLRNAGLVDAWAETFIRTVFAPLEDCIREGLLALLQMRWAGAEAELSERAQAEYWRLCRPGSPDFILDRPDYYAFFTYSLFCGRVAK